MLAALLDDIVAHGIPPERATWYFSLAVGALPGVNVPAEVRRDEDDFDGTFAIQELSSWITSGARASTSSLF
jgi:hypothetical protein